jgi:hypothetical protein
MPEALVALGWMVGACVQLDRDPYSEMPITALARALKRNGAQCDHVDEILRRADAQYAPTPGDPEHPEGDLA